MSIGLVNSVPFQVYLFSENTESLFKIGSRQELSSALGNVLLTLLQREVSYHLAGEMQWELAQHGRLYYSSAACTQVAFNPEPLIDTCSARLSQEIIQWILGEDHPGNPVKLPENLETIFSTFGTLPEWLDKIVAATPFSVLRTKVNLPSFSFIYSDLILEEFSLCTMGQANWPEVIRQYAETLFQNRAIIIQATLAENQTALLRNLHDVQCEIIRGLLETARVDPGGIWGSRAILAAWKAKLAAQVEKIPGPPGDNQPKELAPKKNLEPALNTLQRAIQAFPRPRRLLLRLPKKLQHFVFVILLFIHRRKYKVLGAVLDAAIECLQDMAIEWVEPLVWEGVRGIYTAQIAEIEAAIQTLDQIKTRLNEVNNIFAELEKRYPTQAEPKETAYLVPLVDPILPKWAYPLWKPAFGSVRQELLIDQKLLSNLPELNEHLLAYSQKKFSHIREETAEAILNQISQKQDKKNFVSEILTRLAKACSPLVFPNFDCGTPGWESPLQSFVLLQDPGDSHLAEFLRDEMSNWTPIASHDPYLLLFFQYRSRTPWRYARFTHSSRVGYVPFSGFC